jgi:hypothetical protein
MKVLGAAVFPDEGFALHHAEEHFPVGTVHRRGRGIAQGTDDGVNLRGRNALRGVLRRKEGRQVFFNQNIRQLPVDAVAGNVLVALFYEFVNDGMYRFIRLCSWFNKRL